MTEARFPTDDHRALRSVRRVPGVASNVWMIAVALFLATITACPSPAGGWIILSSAQAQSANALPSVVVSYPLQHDEDRRIAFLGQFSAVNRVEIRAQVGGILAEIHFTDGQIVHQGDLLFVIDPTPYEITLAQAKAQLASAQAKYVLAKQELYRAQTLKATTFGTAENVDERTADASLAEAQVESATAAIRDAAFDLQHCNITAPFAGRIGAHQVSIGGLVAGSRFSTSPTTLLTTLVSLNPIYMNFDMSEADFLKFDQYRLALGDKFDGRVMIRLSDEAHFTHPGRLDFVNNEINRSSGTIHARATVPNDDLSLIPGAFGRLRLSVSPPAPALLVPDASVLLDQDQHIVLTVAPDGTVVPKTVEIGGMRGGLRLIETGLTAKDRVIIDGIVRANPGMKVAPVPGSITYSTSNAAK